MGEAVIHLDVVHREVEQGIEGGEAGPEVVEADLDPLGPEFMERGEGVGTLPGELPLVEFEDEVAGYHPFFLHDVNKRHDLLAAGQVLAGQVERYLEAAAARELQPALQLLAGASEDLAIQILNEAALLGQWNEVEGILQFSLLRDPARHYLQPHQATLLQSDHRLEVGHYPAFPQGPEQPFLWRARVFHAGV
ncbi:hypothetical protein D3C72_382190 [compost metagenome]